MPAATGSWAPDDDPTARWMVDKERLWAELECVPNDVRREVLAEDFVGTAPNGTLYTKAEALEPPAKPRPPARDCKLLGARVRRVGGDVAVVYGKETAARADESGQEVARYLAWTDTWLRRDGRWQIVAVQDMLTPCK